MISGKHGVLQWYEIGEKPYFTIYRKGKEESGNPSYSNMHRENETVQTGKEFLDKCLSLISTGDYAIVCSDVNDRKGGRGLRVEYFSVSISDAAPAAVHAVSGTSGQFDYETVLLKAKEMATEQFERLQEKQQLKDAQEKLREREKELKEANEKLHKPWQRIVADLHPYVGSIAESLGLKKQTVVPSLAGHDKEIEDNNPAGEHAAADRMNKAVHSFCEALQAQYPDNWIQIIEKLTAAIKNDPGKIDMALKFL